MPDTAVAPEVKLGTSGKSFRSPPPGLADAMMAHATTGTTAEPPAKTEPAQPATKAPEPAPAPAAQPSAAAAPKPAPEPPKPATAAPKSGPAQLRETLEKRDAELLEAKKKLAALEETGTATSKQLAEAHTKIAAAEDRYAKAAKRIEELEPLPKRLEEYEKRLQQHEEKLRIADFTGTDEFRDKHEKPIVDLQSHVGRLLKEVTVTTPNGEVPAEFAHFTTVLSAPTHTEALRVAKALFGEDVGPTMANYRLQFKALQDSRSKAVENAALESAEYQKRIQQTAIQEREQTMRSLHAKVEAIFEAEPDVFKPKEDDTDSISALTEGKKFADSLLNAAPDMPREKLVESIATGRARIIKSFVQDKRLVKASEKIKALETELAQYRRSDPPVQTRTTPGTHVAQGGTDTRSRIASAIEDHLAKR